MQQNEAIVATKNIQISSGIEMVYFSFALVGLITVIIMLKNFGTRR